MDSPYHLMYVIGLFATSSILFYEILTVLIFQFYENIKRFKYVYIPIFISDILSAFIWLWGIQLTVYFFTPCHFIISESISQIISFFVNKTIFDYSTKEQAVIVIFFLFIIFATLIYNEVVIINVFSLSHNTKKYINLRQLNEMEDILLKINTKDTNDEESSIDSQ